MWPLGRVQGLDLTSIRSLNVVVDAVTSGASNTVSLASEPHLGTQLIEMNLDLNVGHYLGLDL